jgi:lysophospholipase L1-like esterase
VTDSAGKKAIGYLKSAGTGSKSTAYAIGDSLTAAGTYETYLGQILGGNWSITNAGVGQNRTDQMLARFTPGTATYVIIWGGVNDIAQDVAEATIESNLQAMYTAAHNAGAIVVSINITPWNNSEAWSEARQTVTDNVNTWIAATATDVDYKIDAYTLLESSDALIPGYDSGDHIHLSNAGYSVVADAIYDAAPWAHTGGETLGSDLVLGWNLTSGWTVSSSTITGATTFTNTAASGGVYNSSVLTIGALYKARLEGASSAGELRVQGNGNTPIYHVVGGGAEYRIADDTWWIVWNGGGGVGATNAISRMNVYQVTAPSATGATITSTRGGTTYNWESVEAGFNYNDSAGYTYFIYLPRTKKSKFISQYNYFYRRNK